MSKVAAVCIVFIALVTIFGVNLWILDRRRRNEENDYEMQSVPNERTAEIRQRVNCIFPDPDAPSSSAEAVDKAGISVQESREKGIWEVVDL
ncbi:hypothetical protein A7U60_g4238 [Sanghuangporus baumii]|uniref:Uncharacterized protein n=1 Tax=Sanghuangporus baumii TaxID=108892 RepID=A0A9Q5NCJ1_SANBA|nr:hypothetical protein A7U60_g4238 [Sanghuangporus baumii]